MSAQVIHWSRDTPVFPAQLVTAALAMAGPITYGVTTGHLAHASFAALGAMATGNFVHPPTISRPFTWLAGARSRALWLVRAQGRAGVLVTGAALMGAWLGGRGWVGAVGVVVLAAISAVVGGFSRWTADVVARFITFLVMATGLGGAVWEVARWFALGVAWAILLGLAAAAFPAPVAPAGGVPTYRQLWVRWWGGLHRFEGWQYAVRLVPALAVAEVIGVLWHQEKSYWIALAVVIVVRRRGGSLLRATQRCLGTCVGVLVGGALVVWVPPSGAIVAVVGILAGLRPLLKERNYAAYAAVMTPLVVLLMDLGRTPELSTIGYRLIDTVIGCLIAILPTLILRRRHAA
ncbi:fusaric acid resistance family protein [Kribbella sp. VKM Ac-2571]|uniref:FUSC family protein n=1 Tax=Kribbella sp. VKM Ac-2571 TaxID=2512222 RepID=UPI00105E0E0F|nr:FUSC family protein [Kribbella sp. VKM Ac-2571]TDO62723.1 fusaric acid resistance family protein [Kribbella sp. VKM Ac-2571]